MAIMSNVELSRRCGALGAACVLGILFVPLRVLGCGVEETHPRLAMRALRLLVITAALLGLACELTGQAVEGRVVDDLTGQPVKGVHLFLQYSMDNNIPFDPYTGTTAGYAWAQSRADGTFSFRKQRLGGFKWPKWSIESAWMIWVHRDFGWGTTGGDNEEIRIKRDERHVGELKNYRRRRDN